MGLIVGLETVPTTFASQNNGLGEIMAEGVGFEPTIRVNAYTLSKRAPSATRPSLRTGPYKICLGGRHAGGNLACEAGSRNRVWLQS